VGSLLVVAAVRLMNMRHIRHWAVIVAVIAFVLLSFSYAQQPPIAGSYLVPDGWRVATDEHSATLAAPASAARMQLTVYKDSREPMQVCVDHVSNQMKDKATSLRVVSKKMFTYSTKELARMEVDIKAKGRRPEKEWVLGVPMDSGTLLVVGITPVSKAKEYEPVFDKVAKSVLPNFETRWHPLADEALGLRVMVAPLWEVTPYGTGNNSEKEVLKIKKGDAQLLLSWEDDKHSVKEYIEDFERHAKLNSKADDRIAEERQAIAGVWGVRVEAKTAPTHQHQAQREWLVVFSRNGRNYVVKASAPESQFEQYAADFRAMIDSVAPMPPKAK